MYEKLNQLDHKFNQNGIKSKRTTLLIDFYILYSKQLPQLESTFYPLQPAPSHWFKPSIVHQSY